jgi:branched-subunit amino acid aminotransferase/4-amino-4-deoxychorismate lyase
MNTQSSQDANELAKKDWQVYFNGELLPSSRASLSISDPGFLHGASTFTTMRAHNGVVFRFERHLHRLADTVRLLDLNVGATTGELVDGMYAVLDANALTEARCRITLTPGPPEGRPTTLISAEPLPSYPDTWYTDGIKVIVTALKQTPGDPTFGYKTGCYLPRILGRQEAAYKGADDALWFTHDNHLAESCFSNIFLVLDGVLYTPPRDTPVLPGIVREAVIELCQEHGLECKIDQPLTVHEMLSADEAFLSSSCMGIRPISRIERHLVGDGKPGPITKRIRDAFAALLEAECSRREELETETEQQ